MGDKVMAKDPHTTSVINTSAMIRKLRLLGKEFNDPIYIEAADALDTLLVREEGLVTEVRELSLELKKLREAMARQ
jgi:hypothetical protein